MIQELYTAFILSYVMYTISIHAGYILRGLRALSIQIIHGGVRAQCIQMTWWYEPPRWTNMSCVLLHGPCAEERGVWSRVLQPDIGLLVITCDRIAVCSWIHPPPSI